MSIDAKVRAVHHYENGGGSLKLIDRPGNPPGIAGQGSLEYESAPEEVTALNGLNIWGGSSSIMLGEVEIAKREGYGKIVFHDRETFINAVRKYHEKHR